MGVSSFDQLLGHVGHEIECVAYCDPPENVAIECLTCCEVLLDFNSPSVVVDALDDIAEGFAKVDRFHGVL